MAPGRPALVLLIVAALLLAPSLILGNLISHSSPQNLTWAAQFADQFRAGVVYPRWLPQSFDNLGSPTFYFYPPIGFWVDALVSVVTFNALSVSYRLSLSALLLLWASGLTMHAWLRGQTTSPRVALYGALAWMAAPYHLLDHYYRGAYAEFAAYAVLPLVMLAVRRTAEGWRFGPVLLAVAYAALAMTHLPTALLVSVTAIPLYVLYRAWRLDAAKPALGFLIRCALAGVLGLGLAAVFLVPALGLQDWISSHNFWVGYYQVDNWFLLTPDRWREPHDMMRIISWFAAAYGIAAIGVVVILARKGVREGWRSEAVFWALVCLVCLLFIAGAVPWFWQIPFVAMVQFPWRLMIAVEFAAISALCLMPWPVPTRALSLVFLVAIVALVPGVADMATGIVLRMQASVARADMPADAKEFEPAGFPQNPKGGYADLGLEPLKDVPPIACIPSPRVCRLINGPLGALSVEIDGDAPTTIVVRRFYYPFWRLEPALPVVASDPLRLVSFVAPAGRGHYRLLRTSVFMEKTGWAISGLSLVLVAAWAAAAWRGIRLT